MKPLVREQWRNAAGGVEAPALSADAAGPGGTPYSAAPLSQLFVRQQSRDRNIYDFSLDNQTELTAKFDTGPFGHSFLLGAEFVYESYWNQGYYRNGTCNGVPLQAASATTG